MNVMEIKKSISNLSLFAVITIITIQATVSHIRSNTDKINK